MKKHSPRSVYKGAKRESVQSVQSVQTDPSKALRRALFAKKRASNILLIMGLYTMYTLYGMYTMYFVRGSTLFSLDSYFHWIGTWISGSCTCGAKAARPGWMIVTGDMGGNAGQGYCRRWAKDGK
jgi:hypothetical protein